MSDGQDDQHEWRTSSGIPLRHVYGPEDVPESYTEALRAGPGEAPFLRGAYSGMYRTKPWRIFQLSGYGDPSDMNERLKFLLEAGETGIIVKHDRMTDDHLYDVDHPEIVERREDVGLTGTVTVGLRDYETIMDGIPIERVYTKPGGGVCQSAPYTQSCFWSVALKRGIPLDKISGTGQSDFFLTYVGCPTKEQVPPKAAMRFNLDLIEFCTPRMPRWVPVSIAGYNGADTGLLAHEELGAVFATAIEYLDRVQARGNLDVADFAYKIGGVNFRTSMDFFEDIAKLRVARKMWHDLLKERYGVTDPRVQRLRIHIVTAGSAMTYQEPINNIVRGTVMAMAAALGGTQSLGVSGYDEAMSIPFRPCAPHVDSHPADPSGGDQSPGSGRPSWGLVLPGVAGCRPGGAGREISCARSRTGGGFLEVVDDGWLMRLAEQHQIEQAQEIESGERRIVGVNAHKIDDPIMDVHGFEGASGAVTWERAMERLERLRKERDGARTGEALRGLEAVLRTDENFVPLVMAAVQADASIGEIGGVFRDVYGNWETPITV